MSNKHGIPAELYPRVQSECALLGCVGDEQDRILKTYARLGSISWDDYLRPLILTNLRTIIRVGLFHYQDNES